MDTCYNTIELTAVLKYFDISRGYFTKLKLYLKYLQQGKFKKVYHEFYSDVDSLKHPVYPEKISGYLFLFLNR